MSPQDPKDPKDAEPDPGAPPPQQNDLGVEDDLLQRVKEEELPLPELEEPREPETIPWTPTDKARKNIAYSLLWILGLLLLAAFVTIWVLPRSQGADASMKNSVREEVSFILQQSLGPLITLLGTVCGFYFGGSSGSGGSKGNKK